MIKPNIVFFDVETSPIVCTTWSLWPKSLSHDNIIDDWIILSAAWKTLGDKKTNSICITKPNDDYKVVKTLRDALAKADAIAGHHIDKFDIKKINTRLIYHGLDPLPPIPTIDTLKEIKKVAAFSSNRLDYLAKVLVGQGKIETEYKLWLKCMAGDKAALATMVRYNIMDVVRNEQVYKKIVPYIKTHPHVGVLKGHLRDESCPKCGSKDIKHNGIRVSAAGIKKREVQCNHCHSYSRINFK